MPDFGRMARGEVVFLLAVVVVRELLGKQCYSCSHLALSQDCPVQAAIKNISFEYQCVIWKEADSQAILRQTYIRPEQCNRTEYWTQFIQRRYGLKGTIECCEGDLCNTIVGHNTTVKPETQDTDKNTIPTCTKTSHRNGTVSLVPSVFIAMTDDNTNFSAARQRQKREALDTIKVPHVRTRRSETHTLSPIQIFSETEPPKYRLNSVQISMDDDDLIIATHPPPVTASTTAPLNSSTATAATATAVFLAPSNTTTVNTSLGELPPTVGNTTSAPQALRNPSNPVASTGTAVSTGVSQPTLVLASPIIDTERETGSEHSEQNTTNISPSNSLASQESVTEESAQSNITNVLIEPTRMANASTEQGNRRLEQGSPYTPGTPGLNSTTSSMGNTTNSEHPLSPEKPKIFVFYVKFRNVLSQKNSLVIRLLDGNLDPGRMYSVTISQVAGRGNSSVSVSTEEDEGFEKHSSSIFFHQEMPPLKVDEFTGFWILRDNSSMELGIMDPIERTIIGKSIVKWGDAKKFVDVRYIGFTGGGEGTYLEYGCNYSHSADELLSKTTENPEILLSREINEIRANVSSEIPVNTTFSSNNITTTTTSTQPSRATSESSIDVKIGSIGGKSLDSYLANQENIAEKRGANNSDVVEENTDLANSTVVEFKPGGNSTLQQQPKQTAAGAYTNSSLEACCPHNSTLLDNSSDCDNISISVDVSNKSENTEAEIQEIKRRQTSSDYNLKLPEENTTMPSFPQANFSENSTSDASSASIFNFFTTENNRTAELDRNFTASVGDSGNFTAINNSGAVGAKSIIILENTAAKTANSENKTSSNGSYYIQEEHNIRDNFLADINRNNSLLDEVNTSNNVQVNYSYALPVGVNSSSNVQAEMNSSIIAQDEISSGNNMEAHNSSSTMASSMNSSLKSNEPLKNTTININVTTTLLNSSIASPAANNSISSAGVNDNSSMITTTASNAVDLSGSQYTPPRDTSSPSIRNKGIVVPVVAEFPVYSEIKSNPDYG